MTATLAGLIVLLTGWTAYLPAWINALTAVVTAAAAITALTPSQSDDAFLAKVLKVLDWLSLNFGNAGLHNGTVVKPGTVGFYSAMKGDGAKVKVD